MCCRLLLIAALALEALNGIQATVSYFPQKSPVFPSLAAPTGVVTAVPAIGAAVPTGSLPSAPIRLKGYPTTWKTPPTNSPEIKAAIAAIDWTKVPKAKVKVFDKNGDPIVKGYPDTDPDCWWSDTNCVVPKVKSIPSDIWYCPNPGDWGLTYDDGPLNPPDPLVEPHLYNFLAAHHQRATLFYIGSNVIGFPQAAVRALADGNVICVHTWSHPPMTTIPNNGVVAEFYWTLKVIKEVLGITPKCWRPPYGDVDDRVRAIAWQMGMRTVIWDQDTNDWDMPGEGGGTLSPATVDGYFEGWIKKRKSGKDNVHGHITLEHELNNATVAMAEKWLPTLQKTFNVVPITTCMNISSPYWESSFVYPTEANPGISASASSSAPASSSLVSSSLLTSTLTAGSTSAGSSNSTSAPLATASAQSGGARAIVVSAGAFVLPILGLAIYM